MLGTLRKCLSNKEYLFTFKKKIPFRIINFSNIEILIQTTENKLIKIKRIEIENPYYYIIKKIKITRNKIQKLPSPFTLSYVTPILSYCSSITYQLTPDIELINKNSLSVLDLKKEELVVYENKYDKTIFYKNRFNKNGINLITRNNKDIFEKLKHEHILPQNIKNNTLGGKYSAR